MSGIRTIAGLKDRCRIDSETGCWHWSMSISEHGDPRPWCPALNRRVNIPTLLAILLDGKVPEKGYHYGLVCGGEKTCCNPKHRKLMTFAELCKRAKPRNTPETIARMTQVARKRSKITPEIAKAIRDSEGPLRIQSERYGISVQLACKIRQGKVWRTNVVQGASVFSWSGNDERKAA